jgi:hypothetical protein
MVLAASLTAGTAYADQISATGKVTPSRVAVIAGGRVTSATGAAIPGVAVTLYAWPSDAVLGAMSPGQSVPTALLATAITSSAGRYVLKVSATRLKSAAVASGYANLEIRSAAGGSRFLSYRASALPARPSARLTVNLTGTSSPSCGSDAQHHPYSVSSFTKLSQLKPAWAIIGQGYIVQQKQTAGDFMQFEYGPGQISSLGVGISEYGIDAGYISTGATTSTGGPADFPSETKNTLFRTMFGVGQFRAECFSPDSSTPHQNQHGKCPRTFRNGGTLVYVHKCLWMVESTGWFGGMSVAHLKPIPDAPAKFCTPQKAHSIFKTGNEKAFQWPTGFEIGSANDIKGGDLKTSFSASAQTGYGANAQMQLDFKHPGFACGTTKAAPQAPIVVMRGTKP